MGGVNALADIARAGWFIIGRKRIAAIFAVRSGWGMSPTILRCGEYRFFFFSKEEARMHVHVICADGEAKFWLEPGIRLARNFRLSRVQLRVVEALIEAHADELKAAWDRHFPR